VLLSISCYYRCNSHTLELVADELIPAAPGALAASSTQSCRIQEAVTDNAQNIQHNVKDPTNGTNASKHHATLMTTTLYINDSATL
jgi:hypothetical protein